MCMCKSNKQFKQSSSPSITINREANDPLAPRISPPVLGASSLIRLCVAAIADLKRRRRRRRVVRRRKWVSHAPRTPRLKQIRASMNMQIGNFRPRVGTVRLDGYRSEKGCNNHILGEKASLYTCNCSSFV